MQCVSIFAMYIHIPDISTVEPLCNWHFRTGITFVAVCCTEVSTIQRLFYMYNNLPELTVELG